MTQLHADSVKKVIQTRLLGSVVHYWDEVDSTNAALVRMLRTGAEEGTVVIADRQTAGRGRVGKPWFSPPGVNLYLSVLMKPAIPIADAHFYTLIGSLAIVDALANYDVSAQVKWPNDVILKDKKIAGVLSEIQIANGHLDSLILGVGINVNISRNDMNQQYSDAASGATSLIEVLGRPVDRNVLAARILENLERRHFQFLAHGKQSVVAEWRSCSFLGRRVSINEGGIQVEGIAINLDDEGCLVVTLDDGSTAHVREGEVLLA
ncbi:MAG: biotin--[acetyl-CoA-carboxylase] ligase [Deltaproteobacteria bacterium]|nr:biotin--[acetyl-CoA-carboxylase] ligase [Deltaproteobacteria bacterium]